MGSTKQAHCCCQWPLLLRRLRKEGGHRLLQPLLLLHLGWTEWYEGSLRVSEGLSCWKREAMQRA